MSNPNMARDNVRKVIAQASSTYGVRIFGVPARYAVIGADFDKPIIESLEASEAYSKACEMNADAILAAIAEAGLAVVPREANDALSVLGGQTEGMKEVDNVLKLHACRAGSFRPFSGDGTPLQQSWRAMVAVADLASDPEKTDRA